MHVRKRIFAFLFAALAMALLTACGKWDYSREAMKAANDAQGENIRVTFEIDQKFTSSLRGAAEDNIQPADVKNAMAMDKTIEKLLTSGYRLDIYALRADTDAAKAAAQATSGTYPPASPIKDAAPTQNAMTATTSTM